jgi:cytochrome P450
LIKRRWFEQTRRLPQEQEQDRKCHRSGTQNVRHLLAMDPPEHKRLRKLLNKGFSSAVVEGLGPQVEEIVEQMLKPLQCGSELELMHEFANPMPVRIILEMLGIP